MAGCYCWLEESCAEPEVPSECAVLEGLVICKEECAIVSDVVKIVTVVADNAG